ncbi:hypothetical protein PFISCL1PPCAC_21707, partial [Pristionchus fissidentatus]
TPSSPTSTATFPSRKHSDVPGSVNFLARMAFKMFGVVSKRFDRAQSVPSTSMDPGKEAQRQNPTTIVYQQSSTRKLAFGGSTDVEADKKPMDDFYNNSTLTNVTKVFCAAVLLTAFCLVMSKSFNFDFQLFG